MKIATVESCIGGLVSFSLASEPGVSPCLERGFVVYSLDAKCELPGLRRAQIDGCYGVSAEVAYEMAQGALSHADVAIAVAGFAGPQERSEEVGLVYLASILRDREAELRTCHFGDIGRLPVCRKATEAALDMLATVMESTTDSVERWNVGNVGNRRRLYHICKHSSSPACEFVVRTVPPISFDGDRLVGIEQAAAFSDK